MATAITMKRYDATQQQWVELAPSTTIAQVSGLQDALNLKQDTLTFDDNPTIGSDHPVKSGGVYTSISNVMNVAEGKTKSYVTTLQNPRYLLYGNSEKSVGVSVSYVQEGVNSAQILDSTDTFTIDETYIYLTYYDEDSSSYKVKECLDISDLKIGDILLITQTVKPDFWVSGVAEGSVTFNKLETTKVDLDNYVTTNTSQTIGSNATKLFLASVNFDSGIKLKTTSTFYTTVQGDGNSTTNNIVTLPSKTGTLALEPLYAYAGSATDSSGTMSSDYLSNLNYSNLTAVGFGPHYSSPYLFLHRTSSGVYVSTKDRNFVQATINVSTGAWTKYSKTLNSTDLGSDTPTNAIEGDIWFVTS